MPGRRGGQVQGAAPSLDNPVTAPSAPSWSAWPEPSLARPPPDRARRAPVGCSATGPNGQLSSRYVSLYIWDPR